jgi:hypothetical protein
LYLSGILSSALSLLFLTSVLNIFAHSSFLFNVNLVRAAAAGYCNGNCS